MTELNLSTSTFISKNKYIYMIPVAENILQAIKDGKLTIGDIMNPNQLHETDVLEIVSFDGIADSSMKYSSWCVQVVQNNGELCWSEQVVTDLINLDSCYDVKQLKTLPITQFRPVMHSAWLISEIPSFDKIYLNGDFSTKQTQIVYGVPSTSNRIMTHFMLARNTPTSLNNIQIVPVNDSFDVSTLGSTVYYEISMALNEQSKYTGLYYYPGTQTWKGKYKQTVNGGTVIKSEPLTGDMLNLEFAPFASRFSITSPIKYGFISNHGVTSDFKFIFG